MAQINSTCNYLNGMDFGDESADDAPLEELMSYFVEQQSFSPYINFSNRLLIAKAKKGNGKSAILQWIYHKASHDNSVVVVKCRGAELSRSKFGFTTSLENPNDRIYDWMARLCTVINRELARKIKFACSDTSIALVETAELDGIKQKNIVRALLDRFKISLHGYSVETEIPRITSEIDTLKKVANPKVVLIIDDLDSTFQNTREECLNLSTFFSACRYLIQDFPGVVIRASVRTDVWPLIRPFDEAMDKIDQYVLEISWTEKDFIRLLNKRIAKSLAGDEGKNLLDLIFQDKMKWGDKNVKNHVVLYTIAYERPRWCIQLCKSAQQVAIQKDHHRILLQDIESAWVEYGKKRVNDLQAEHKHQCPQIIALVNAFRGQPSQMSRETLLKIISDNVSSRTAVSIDSTSTRSALEIAYFLYRIGFIVAKATDGKWYYHYSFEDFSSLLSCQTQKDEDFMWEIHPCYRMFLDIKSLNAATKAATPRI